MSLASVGTLRAIVRGILALVTNQKSPPFAWLLALAFVSVSRVPLNRSLILSRAINHWPLQNMTDTELSDRLSLPVKDYASLLHRVIWKAAKTLPSYRCGT